MDAHAQYSYLKPQSHVWIFILGSGAVHAFLIGLMILGGTLKESRSNTRDDTKIMAILRKGQPRPKKWLPRKPPAPVSKPSVPKNSRPDPSAKPKPSEPSRAIANTTPKNYSKEMQQALSMLGKEGGGKSADPLEGSPEGAEDGTSLIAQLGSEYMTKVYTAIKGQYKLPEIISQRERMFLQATAVITINTRGGIKKLVFEKRSGNSIFDSAIEGAILRAAPFPPPPEELRSKYASEGIGLDFDARSM